MDKYTVLTAKSIWNIDTESDEARWAFVEEQDSILERLGYDTSRTDYIVRFENGETHTMTIEDAIQRLAIKEGCDLVRFENGHIGYVAYYNEYKDSFEIIDSVASKREQLEEYIGYLKENHKADYVRLWETCCDLCGWLDLDHIHEDEMIDIILDYNTSLFDEGIKAILES